MSTARVPWSRLTAEEMEHTAAMLLCAKHPAAVHFTPGPDGGIDVYVPDGDRGRIVFQVKHFPNNYASSEFRQTRRSIARVMATAEREGWKITEWHLVIPRGPSPTYRTRIDAEVTAAGIPRWSWIGLTQIDILAADYPRLVDYYLNGGKDRFAAQIGDLAAIIRSGLAGPAGTPVSGPLEPHEIGERMMRLQHAGDNDPHYRYHFATSDTPPQREYDHEPWLVAVAGERHGDIWIHIKVYARFAAALTERPITGSFTVNTSGDPSLAEEFERHLEYGTPVRIPSSAASATLDLPGSLGGELEQAEIYLSAIVGGPDSPEPVEHLILGVRDDESGDIVAELPMKVTGSATFGPRGGTRAVWRDDSAMVTLAIETRIAPLHVGVSATINWDVGGKRPGDVLAGLEAIAAMRPGTSIGISREFGPRQYVFGSPDSMDEPHPMLKTVVHMVRALSIVQNHYSRRILIPDEMSVDELSVLREAAELLQGRATKGTWEPFAFTADNDTDAGLIAIGTRLSVAIVTPIVITLDGAAHEVGEAHSFLDATVTAADDRQITLSPTTPGSSCTRTLATGTTTQWLTESGTPSAHSDQWPAATLTNPSHIRRQ